MGKYDLLIELQVKDNQEFRNIIDKFRNKFVDKYNDYDISTIIKEYLIIWSPFFFKIEILLLTKNRLTYLQIFLL